MGQDYNTGFCKQCNVQKKLERKATSHLLHFIITVILGLFTAGVGAIFWIVIWVLLSVFKFGGWRCSTCGSKRNSKNTVVNIALVLLILGGISFFSIKHYEKKLEKDKKENKTYSEEINKDVENDTPALSKAITPPILKDSQNPQGIERIETKSAHNIDTSNYSAQQLNDLGYEYYKKKDYLNAYKYWHETTEKYPKFAMGHYNLACVMNIMLDNPQYNKKWPSISQKEIIESLKTSIKYKKNRWKRMQKDSDLKSLYSAFAYQKLLGINLNKKKDIQKILTRLKWNNAGTSINFIANITKSSGRFVLTENNSLVNGSYSVLSKNKIKFKLNNGKTLTGKLKVENRNIEEDFIWVSVRVGEKVFYNSSKVFADYD